MCSDLKLYKGQKVKVKAEIPLIHKCLTKIGALIRDCHYFNDIYM